MHHLYLSIYNDAAALQQEREALVAWCVENGVMDYDFIEDNLTIGRIPEKRIKALLEPIRHGDTVVASEMSRLGRSLSMFQTVMNHIWNNECTIITLEGRTIEPNRTMTLFVNALNDIVELERQMKGFRSKDVLHVMRENGATLGRPMGARRKQEKIVLYGKTEELERLHAQGLSPQRIADALHVSRGTVANYLTGPINNEVPELCGVTQLEPSL